MSEENNYNLSRTALYLGVPVLVGASCYYLYSSRNKNSSNDSAAEGSGKKLTPIEHAMQLKVTGNQNFARKNYDVAIEHYTNAIELGLGLLPNLKPDDLAIFYQNRAACREALGQNSEVVEDCNKALELNKTYAKAYIRRAKALQKSQDYDKALVDAFSANLLEKFQNQSTMSLTEEIVKASSKAKAAEAMKTHNPGWPSNQIIKSYFSAFTHDPISEKLNGITIRTCEQLQPIFEDAMKPDNDNDPIYLLIRGSCLSLRSDLEGANAIFDKILQLSDEVCSARIKANTLIKRAALVISEPTSMSSNVEKDIEQVLELLEQAIKLDPENPDIYLHKAQALTLLEKLEEAIKALIKAIELKNDFFSAIAQKYYIEFKLATRNTDMSMSKLQTMLDKFKSAVQENPEAPDLLHMYAQVLTETNYFEQADEILLKLSKLDPTDGSVYVTRALLHFNLKSGADEVASLLRTALKIDPKIIFAYEILGSIETQKGNVDKAIEIFETAVKYAQTEADYARCYSLVDSAKCQKVATQLFETQA